MAAKPKKAEPAKKGSKILVDLSNPLGKSRQEDALEFDVIETTPDQFLIQNGSKQQWVSRFRTFPVQGSL